jgi:hypothetical protein
MPHAQKLDEERGGGAAAVRWSGVIEARACMGEEGGRGAAEGEMGFQARVSSFIIYWRSLNGLYCSGVGRSHKSVAPLAPLFHSLFHAEIVFI